MLASEAASAVAEGRACEVLLDTAPRMVSDWRSPGWYGLSEADDLRRAMSASFSGDVDWEEFEDVLRACSGMSGASPVSSEARARAARRLRDLEAALS
jgi:hypothetical protein